jgi:hypothetical protein
MVERDGIVGGIFDEGLRCVVGRNNLVPFGVRLEDQGKFGLTKRLAVWTMVLKTGCRSNVEWLMTLSTSAVAAATVPKDRGSWPAIRRAVAHSRLRSQPAVQSPHLVLA